MNVRDLSRERIIQLKQNYMVELADLGMFAEVCDKDYDAPSYGDMANADSEISDDTIFEYWDGVDFSDDDFFCTAGN